MALGLTLPGERQREPGSREAAHAGAVRDAAPPAARSDPRAPARAGAASPAPSAPPSPSVPATLPPAPPAAAAAKANELGRVPVLMYHRILPKPQLSLDRSTKELRDELTRLAKGGYVPITAAEFVGGRFDVPAGRHPVVLTFDDSTPGHFGLDAQGNVKPDTAVAIIQEVARAHPGFRPVATFYANKDLFGLGDQAAAGLAWLTSRGFEIANHTVDHSDLSRLDRAAVQKEIGGMEDRLRAVTGRNTATFAYPFGSVPRKRDWARRQDGRYDFQGMFLAGWQPSPSPFDSGFDRFAIARVRSEGKIKENDCQRFCSVAWLDHLDKNPQERYTSDGDPNAITIPRSAEERLAKDFRARARVW
ncbi:polysaccharide deacetylase family protein [Actinomadura namibiensis]|uniref:Peptidoglycan/xylan/chitin deacetylase (PgdA/CDA1 family) n=1 Tax=Actinomadura namibiensis TaxID=182080 RepID=A0A7W3LT68_ACTNM|nr:polysaccharide deacetylase family protein [Actinomadura namibiensis]MBA8953843.1 peptidoglycan/xylan/chitin deacetylase (PgdA/CDA1 family) [Actinomadura namibiensis]